jgi:hypothetical protein
MDDFLRRTGSGVVENGVQSRIPLYTTRECILVLWWEDAYDSVRASDVARVPPR